ncbi:hypothetical protein [Actibacterium ureilyticum]|uniref:hypothetical protein n=1 Tax=Actibacterium ureilyticum TaxID=1590614 RepID=UPI000BAAAFB6|nr:hypothetical protein [Actibacterium ureilyticum]
MKPPRNPTFLARQSYRRRRVRDSARLLPVLGMFLFLLPLLGGPQGETRTAVQLVYLFVSWFGLILAAGILARLLRYRARDGADGDANGDPT